MTSRLLRRRRSRRCWRSAAGCGEKTDRGSGLPRLPVGVNLVKNPVVRGMERGACRSAGSSSISRARARRRTLYGNRSTRRRAANSRTTCGACSTSIDGWFSCSGTPCRPGTACGSAPRCAAKDLQKNRGQETRANIYVTILRQERQARERPLLRRRIHAHLTGTSDWQRIGPPRRHSRRTRTTSTSASSAR